MEKTTHNPSNLDKKLSNTFQRITLANVANKERVTIDNAINFSNKKKKKTLQNLVVIEIKKSKTWILVSTSFLKLMVLDPQVLANMQLGLR